MLSKDVDLIKHVIWNTSFARQNLEDGDMDELYLNLANNNYFDYIPIFSTMFIEMYGLDEILQNVTALYDYMFEHIKDLPDEIVLPDNITYIGYKVFFPKHLRLLDIRHVTQMDEEWYREMSVDTIIFSDKLETNIFEPILTANLKYPIGELKFTGTVDEFYTYVENFYSTPYDTVQKLLDMGIYISCKDGDIL